jgi:site-specific recombinase XerD
MNIKYILSATKNSWRVSVRMYYGKFDLSLALPIFIENSSDWDSESQQLANSSILNEKLSELKTSILKQYNLDFTQGILFNKEWLKNVVSDVFNRPSGEKNLINNDAEIYFTDFGYWWIKNHSANWKVSAKKFISKVQISQYKKFLDQVVEFEKSIGIKLVLKDLTQDEIYEFANYLEENGYNSSTIERAIGRVKFFCNRAIEKDIKVNSSFKQRTYIEKEEETDGVFLDEIEINKILNKDFSFDPDLETTKDNFTIAIFSGMRSSDFLTNLDISNFKEGYIQITTQKTKSRVVVPVHKQVEFVLKKYHGMLPPKQTNADFNKHIKTLCQLCDIDNVMRGKVFDSKKKRKVLGNYPKYKMVTAHSLRRSFCSNMRGKISDDSLCKIMGWSTDKLISLYDKNSRLSHANNLLSVWNKE